MILDFVEALGSGLGYDQIFKLGYNQSYFSGKPIGCFVAKAETFEM
jgi:hypothetical protein